MTTGSYDLNTTKNGNMINSAQNEYFNMPKYQPPPPIFDQSNILKTESNEAPIPVLPNTVY